MRKLASIQRIVALDPIPGADKIEVAQVLGWKVVTHKGDFKVGDLCLFCEIDSILPPKEEYEFMADYKYRVKTIRLRKQVSQGLALPIASIKYVDLSKYKESDDVTQVLGVTKYEPGITQPGNAIPRKPKPWYQRAWNRILLALHIRKPESLAWPSFLRKTDEQRIQSCPGFLRRHKGELFYSSEKLDGCSCTIYLRKGRFGVCSRNWEIPRDGKYSGNDVRAHFWGMIARFGIEKRMRELGRNIAIQGELIGPGIQGNKYRSAVHRLYLFGVYDIDAGRYLDIDDALLIAAALGLDWCPMLGRFTLDHTIDQLEAMSGGKSKLGSTEREGIVVRAVKESGDPDTGRASFKVISKVFLLRFEDKEEPAVPEAA